MLMLLFYAGTERYALKCQYILAVVPMVELTRPRKAPVAMAGIMRYRHQMVPVIDLCQLLQGTPACNHLSTRIMLIEYPIEEERRILGLVAERVTETITMEKEDFHGGDLAMDRSGIIQQVRLDRLVSNLNASYLLSGDAALY